MKGIERRKKRRKEKKRRSRRFLFVFVLIISIFLVRTTYNYSQKSTENLVDSGDTSESILLMSEKSVVNTAFQEKKKVVEGERAKIIHKERKEEITRMQKKKAEEMKRKQEEAKQPSSDRKENIAYLTFDDGPSSNMTAQILDILARYNIKGTFFILGKSAEENPDILRRVYKEGHAIGHHSYSHNYNHIYSNTDIFMEEIHETERLFKKILGNDFETKIIRFPGGSFGESKASFRERVVRDGYNFYDWNSLIGDAEEKQLSKDGLVNRLKETSQGKGDLVILMHDADTKQSTADVLPKIIEYLQGKHYEFEILK